MATRSKRENHRTLPGSLREIWLAGLGALNLVGEEGGRVFSDLVEKGKEWEEANEGGRLAKLSERAQNLTADARTLLGRAASPLEDGLAAAMKRMGVPTRSEIVKLTERVEEMTRIVQQARRGSAAKAGSPAKPAAKAKAKAEPASRSRSASKARAGAKAPSRAKAETKSPVVTA